MLILVSRSLHNRDQGCHNKKKGNYGDHHACLSCYEASSFPLRLP